MATYDRDAVVEAMTALYQTVLLMGDVPISELTTPPDGWIPPAGIKKSAAVIDLMAHLPYHSDTYLVVETSPINYLAPNWTDGRWIPFDPWGIKRTYPIPEEYGGRPADITEDEVAITMQKYNLGKLTILDTKTGMVRIVADTMSQTECQVHGAHACPHHLCRHAVSRSTESRPVLDVLREWRQKYLDLDWMVDCCGPPDVTGDDWHDEELLDRMRSIYRAHGWPHEYSARECRDALEDLRYREDEYESN
ncbi:hypothetical protein LTR17_026970 [Elasticomyces elasticus]|nr:hypothetical protein LTR17_026970 [Elasticomyces elasticus]